MSRSAAASKSQVLSLAVMLVALALLTQFVPAWAADGPVTINGKAILDHPAGKAMVEAGRLLHAGKAGESRKIAAKEVREEWAAMSPAEQKQEAERLQGRTPEPKAFEADIARVGELIVDGTSARLSIPTASGDPSAMAFAELENGKWRASRGPMTLQVPEPESAPAIRGAAILDHPLGKLALDYAGKLAAGKMDAAMALVSTTTRARLAEISPAERQESEKFRRTTTPKPEVFKGQIQEGGELAFYGDKAVLNVISSSTVKNADGSVTSTSDTVVIGFEKENDRWVISN